MDYPVEAPQRGDEALERPLLGKPSMRVEERQLAKAAAILGNDRQAAVQRLGSEPGEMRRQDDIRQAEERIMRAGRLVGKYI